MRLLLSWIKQCLSFSPVDLEKLTLSGIEVDSIKECLPSYSNLIPATVVKLDNDNMCTVETASGELLTAFTKEKPNIFDEVVFAYFDSYLPNGCFIDVGAYLQKSETICDGLLCSYNELLLSGDTNIYHCDDRVSYENACLLIKDSCINFSITPNRGDCLSVIGIVREIAAVCNYKIKLQQLYDIPYKTKKLLFDVQLNVSRELINYAGVMIDSIDNSIVLPEFITNRLICSGFNLNSPIVDICNYVMLYYGQPLHAFDTALVGSEFIIEHSKTNEDVLLLNNKQVTLKDGSIVIRDSNNDVAAISGILGSKYCAISNHTNAILLESVFFDPSTIIGHAKHYGLNSDAAYRFERGVDYKIQKPALSYCIQLINQFLGGENGIIIEYPILNKEQIIISFNIINCYNVLGVDISVVEIEDILFRLGFIVTNVNDNKLIVLVPSHRFDISNEYDLIEEVARVYGYNNISAIPPNSTLVDSVNNEYSSIYALKVYFVAFGYQEVINYAFIEDDFSNLNYLESINNIKLLNPIASLAYLQTSLISGLIKNLCYNVYYSTPVVRLFELSDVFWGCSQDEQPMMLAGLSYTKSGFKSSWNDEGIDFFAFKSTVDGLLTNLVCGKYKYVPFENKFFEVNCAACIYLDDSLIGVIGQLNSSYTRKLNIPGDVYVFELKAYPLLNSVRELSLKPVSLYQRVERDLCFVVDSKFYAGDLIEHIDSLSLNYLEHVYIFDVYSNMNDNKKNISIRITFRANKTLTEIEINEQVSVIVNSVCSFFVISLR